MLATRMRMAAAGTGGGYTADAAIFDGTNDFLSRGGSLTGDEDADELSIVFWIDFTGGDGVLQVIFGQTDNNIVSKQTGNVIRVALVNTAVSAEVLRVDSTSTLLAAAGWTCVMISTKRSTQATHLYFGDTSVKDTPVTDTAANYKFTAAEYTIGGAVSGPGGNKIAANLFDFWLAQEYIDFSVEANRRKFIDASGMPVDLGADGSTPTGTAPIIFQHLDDGEAAANFAVNAGSGGGMTVTGTLTSTDGPMG